MLPALFLAVLAPLSPAVAQDAAAPLPVIELVSDGSGTRLRVDGRDMMIQGVNWDYFPRGTTYNYNFWTEPDHIIEAALEREMSVLVAMGGNAIRTYVGITPKWVRHIYERYGIYTILNHAMGRYGVTVGGVFSANTDYSDPRARAVLTAEIEELVDEFKGTPGLLMWLLGNENNYGLVWNSAETEDLPEGEADAVRARHMYSLFGEVARRIKEIDPSRPVAMANGDLQYLDIIAEEVPDVDVFGANVYRGVSFGQLFREVDDVLDRPVMFTEFGADAWDARNMREDQTTQARYLIGQWREIYEQSAGKGMVGNSIGGLTFQWTDGWWKFGQEDRLDIQDTNASWANGGYVEDFVEGDNNMNEEWWGIVAKGPTELNNLYELFPRAAYYALQEAYTLDPYAPGTDLTAIREHFGNIQPAAMALRAQGDRSALLASALDRVHVRGVRMELETYSTGGSLVSTPEEPLERNPSYPSFRGFDRMQSFYADVAAQPTQNMLANVSFNMLGDVPSNPIDEIFYENRGRPRNVRADGEDFALQDIERLKVYNAGVSWDDRWFHLEGFYRTGHYHWGYEGDFFGLYQEANYGPNIDIYNGQAPVGMEIAGKRFLGGLKVAIGPELWWGANPAVLVKHQSRIGPLETAVIYQEDLAEAGATTSSFAIPLPPTRKATVHVATTRNGATFEAGGIMSGGTKVGETFQVVDGEPGSYRVLQDEIRTSDAFGAKAKISYTRGRLNWYLQGAAMGLVADGGFTQTQTFTGWTLKDTGSGNQRNVITGFTVLAGNWQIAPNFLWRKPLVGPVPAGTPAPGRPRNVLDDPFAVRGNRETRAAEVLFTYDPTPATWMYNWDSDRREDAALAASIGFVYYSFPTTQDAGIGIFADGRSTFAFPGAPPPRDLWEVKARVVSKRRAGPGLIANVYAGTGEPNGDDERVISRAGIDLRVISGSLKFQGMARFNDWGPYDYHRDFNLTFPLQLMGDISYTLGLPDWFDLPQTRFGVRATWRSLNEYSPRYCPGMSPDDFGRMECNPDIGGEPGREWEIRTYLHIAI
ncbi:glycoside hydrolase family 2 TIM barrel-domain containing protein [Candidatus Palauibacter sp.]|uniref:glycoside hydrolase family 2 TIM barrel-domain containing protein n=1 Tax=Candidatus Palauibacter sp. TaxID=3101350 RepID=UPI003B5203EB